MIILINMYCIPLSRPKCWGNGDILKFNIMWSCYICMIKIGQNDEGSISANEKFHQWKKEIEDSVNLKEKVDGFEV